MVIYKLTVLLDGSRGGLLAPSKKKKNFEVGGLGLGVLDIGNTISTVHGRRWAIQLV